VKQGGGGSKTVIDRSASKSAKGPRLQRLRASLFLVQSLANDGNIQAYVSIETEGDVLFTTATAVKTDAYSEEDKNYSDEGFFTFVSPSVLNSVVIFADQWIERKYALKVRFGLYTTVDVAKERNAGRVQELGLTLPTKPIIELLRSGDFTDSTLLPCVHALVIDEYKRQYARTKLVGHAALIEGWDEATLKEFLSRITWLFCAADEQECEDQVIEAIKKCPHYRDVHEGKEDLILAALLELLDKKQLAADHVERFVHASDLIVLFHRVESGGLTYLDPTWEAWEKLPPPVDQRNVREKFLAACPKLKKRSLIRYQRQTAAGHMELQAHAQDKSVLALRYQVYDACEAAVADLAQKQATLTEEELQNEVERLVDVAIARIEGRPEYAYKFKNEAFLKSVVLSLFDSCFLSLDGGSDE